MLEGIRNFFHHLFNPHCEECIDISSHCQSCETLREQLAHYRQENERLLSAVLNQSPVAVQSDDVGDPKLVKPRFVPWRVRQRQLENKSKAKLRDMPKTDVDKLEMELQIPVGDSK